CAPAIPVRSPAIVGGASLAYLTLRRLEPAADGESRWELGAASHGATGPQLADRLCGQIRAWNEARTAQPVITVHSGRTNTLEPWEGSLIRKRSTSPTVAY